MALGVPILKHFRVCRLTFFFSAHPLIMSYICTKFHGNSFHGFKNTNQGGLNLHRGIIP